MQKWKILKIELAQTWIQKHSGRVRSWLVLRICWVIRANRAIVLQKVEWRDILTMIQEKKLNLGAYLRSETYLHRLYRFAAFLFRLTRHFWRTASGIWGTLQWWEIYVIMWSISSWFQCLLSTSSCSVSFSFWFGWSFLGTFCTLQFVAMILKTDIN